MQTDAAKTVLEKLKNLSKKQQEDVLEFVESIEPKGRTPWQIWQDIPIEIPDDELEKIPADASVNLDHYLYGASKR
ncbi:MAG: hypothetical protein ABL999_02885 [Pyrinomonadaceae bacterium]